MTKDCQCCLPCLPCLSWSQILLFGACKVTLCLSHCTCLKHCSDLGSAEQTESPIWNQAGDHSWPYLVHSETGVASSSHAYLWWAHLMMQNLAAAQRAIMNAPLSAEIIPSEVFIIWGKPILISRLPTPFGPPSSFFGFLIFHCLLVNTSVFVHLQQIVSSFILVKLSRSNSWEGLFRAEREESAKSAAVGLDCGVQMGEIMTKQEKGVGEIGCLMGRWLGCLRAMPPFACRLLSQVWEQLYDFT